MVLVYSFGTGVLMWREWYPFPWVPVVDEEGMRFNDWFPRFTSVMAFDVTRKTLHKSLCRIKSYHCFSQRWPLNRSSSMCACDASCFKIQETKEYQQPCFILVLANHHISCPYITVILFCLFHFSAHSKLEYEWSGIPLLSPFIHLILCIHSKASQYSFV